MRFILPLVRLSQHRAVTNQGELECAWVTVQWTPHNGIAVWTMQRARRQAMSVGSAMDRLCSKLKGGLQAEDTQIQGV
jgi:hypothetical protein